MQFKKLFIHLLALAVFLNTLFWTVVIPYNDAPDEFTHFEVSKFIADNNRFPVFGIDENMGVSKYEELGFRAYYNASYSSMPPLAYLIQAFAIKIFPAINEVDYYLAARISSAVLSFIFVLVCFKLAKVLFAKFYQQLSFTLLSVLIPQITFTFSYVNSDALTLLLSTVLFYYLVLMIKDKLAINLKNSLFLGVFLGLTALTRYNAFILFPFIVLFYFNKLRLIKGFKNKVKFGSVFCLSAILISGWWYLRNLIIYQDLLGTKRFWQTVYMLHPRNRLDLSVNSFGYILLKTDWLWQNFRTFWASFGWNHIFLPESFYRLILLMTFWGIFAVFKNFKKEEKFYQRSLLLNFFLFLFSISLSLWQSWKFAFQAQGRYFFPILPALIFIIVFGLFGLSKEKLYQAVVFLFICLGTIFLNIISLISYIIPAYY